MGHLAVRNPGLYRDAGIYQAIHVDMDYYSYSNRQVLMTWGAGPCVNIVVNNFNTNTVGLSHVWNNTFSQRDLYRKAERVVDLLVGATNAQNSGEIYLFAGQAFKAGTIYQRTNLIAGDLSEYITGRYAGRYLVYDFMSTAEQPIRPTGGEFYSGDLAINPAGQEVFLLSTAELRLIQANMVNLGSARLPA